MVGKYQEQTKQRDWAEAPKSIQRSFSKASSTENLAGASFSEQEHNPWLGSTLAIGVELPVAFQKHLSCLASEPL